MTDAEKLDLILTKVNSLDARMDSLDARMDSLDTRMSNLERKVDDFESDLREVRHQTAQTNLILENEIRVNIQRVAEGHLDLSRNLHDAMRPSNEVEMLAIKVRMLESDVKELKRKIS